jgi:Zn-dependent peptidase ImmA (M78 family)
MTTATRDPERDAQDLLESAWGHRLPVDPIFIARELGIQVYNAYLDPGVSGTLEKTAGYADPVITLNIKDSRNRRRFTCAHELGHYVMRSNSTDSGRWTYIDRRDPLSKTGRDPEEVYANRFAAALLMPADRVKQLWAEHHNQAALAAEFKVSADAISFRLENLELL